MKLHASEQDHDDQVEDPGFIADEEDVAPDQVTDEDDAGLTGDEQPDGAPVGDQGQTDELAVRRARRSIEERAARVREREVETPDVGATVRSVIMEQDAAARRREEERREAEIVATMTDEQRMTYQAAKQGRDAQNAAQSAVLMSQSAADQSRFDRLLMRNRAYEKYEDEIEKRHQQNLARGLFVSRTEILKHYIGEQALKQTRANEQRASGQRRIQAQRGAPAAPRGNVRGGGGATKSVVQRAEDSDWAI